MKLYKVEKYGTLLVVRCCLEGVEGKAYPKLLVDMLVKLLFNNKKIKRRPK